MKSLLFLLFINVFGFTANAKTYYISNAGNDTNPGTDSSASWQTLSKVNSAAFNPGDNILFKRGDIFYGKIIVNNSGNSLSPITYGAYGTGDKPVITGFTSVVSWTNLGSNIWESSNPVSTLPALKLVVIDGINTPIGRLPNSDASFPFLPNYFTIDSHTGTGIGSTTITSTSLSGKDWTGADIVVRTNHWTLDKGSVTSQTGSTITYSGQADGVENGAGFFIQNDARTLDVQNEWYYNPSTMKTRIYSTSQPVNVKIATIDTLFYASAKNYISIDGLNFTGANTSAIVFSSCSHPTITSSNVSFTGATALEAQNTSNYLDVENSSFFDVGGAAIWNTDNGTNWIIKNNTFTRCGLVSVIKPNDYSGGAIQMFSDNALVQYNVIDSAGFNGIHFRGNNVQVRNNFINHTNFLRDDGAGIYTGFTGETGKIIDGNIVLNSIGNSRGTVDGEAAGNGIYLDGLTDDATVNNNTVAHIASAGIFLNNGRLNKVHNNTVYDIGGEHFTRGCLMVQTYNGAPYSAYQRNNNVTNNIFFQKRASQVDVFYYTASDKTNTIQDFGILDSNYYAKANDTSHSIIATTAGSDYHNLNFSQWQSFSGKEAHGHFYNKLVDTSNIRFIYNPAGNDSTISLGAKYVDVKGNTYNGSITLSPFSGAVLIYVSPSTSNIPPVADVGSDREIQLPKNNIVLPGSGKDSDGIVVSYLWTQLSGPSKAIITNANLANGSVSDLIEGKYQFQLTVTDDKGAEGTKVLNVIVDPMANIAPTADVGQKQIITLPINTVTLNGSGTDSDGTINSYRWSCVSGPSSYNIVNPDLATTDVSGLVQGVYQFKLTVTDNGGAVASATVQVTVNSRANIPPNASSGTNKSITLPVNTITLVGSGSDADGTIVSYQWTKISGPAAYNIVNATSPVTDVSGLTQGVYQFQLAVKDNKGDIGTAIVQINVNAAVNIPPSANAGTNKSITLPTNSASLSGSGSDADGSIGSYQWTKISGPSAYNIVDATSPVTDVSGLTQGVYQFQLTVKDNKGDIGTAIMQINVNAAANIPPSANAGTNKSITLPTNIVSLTGSGKDADGTIDSYQWIRISGPSTFKITKPNSASTNVTDLIEGIYQFQLTVKDDKGDAASSTVQVTVNKTVNTIITPPNIAPVAFAGNDTTLVFPNNSITLSGTGSDSDGSITSWLWDQVSGPTLTIKSSSNTAMTNVSNLVEGTYEFELAVTDNKGLTGRDTIRVTVALARLARESDDVKVYPNPVSDLATVEINAGKANIGLLILITDMSGKSVYKKQMVLSTDNVKEQINMSNFSEGAYIVTVFFDNVIRRSIKILKL